MSTAVIDKKLFHDVRHDNLLKTTLNQLIKAFGRMGIDVKVVDFLENAVKVAYEFSEKGDTILLSPAAASWDQYKCFEDRGNEYKRVINELK